MIRKQTFVAALALLSMLGCPDAPLDADPADDEDGDTVDVCQASLSWEEGPPLPIAVDHHHTFVAETDAGPALYALGGFDGSRSRSEVFRALIHDDGRLSPFETAGELPEPRSGAALAVSGAHVVLAGGMVQQSLGPSFSASVLVGTLLDDGSLAWVSGPPLPGVRFHAAGAEHEGAVLVSGGVDAVGDAQSDVFRAVLEGGSLSSWQRLTPLPAPRSHHAALVHDGALFVVAGLSGNPFRNDTDPYDDVWRADIGDEGTLSSFRIVADQLGLALATHAATAADSCFFIVGGGVGDAFTASDALHRVDYEGKRTEMPAPLPAAFTHRHHAPLYGSAMYAVAGGRDHVPSDRVFIGLFTASR